MKNNEESSLEFVLKDAIIVFLIALVTWSSSIIALGLMTHNWSNPFNIIFGLALLPLSLSGGFRRR